MRSCQILQANRVDGDGGQQALRGQEVDEPMDKLANGDTCGTFRAHEGRRSGLMWFRFKCMMECLDANEHGCQKCSYQVIERHSVAHGR